MSELERLERAADVAALIAMRSRVQLNAAMVELEELKEIHERRHSNFVARKAEYLAAKLGTISDEDLKDAAEGVKQ